MYVWHIDIVRKDSKMESPTTTTQKIPIEYYKEGNRVALLEFSFLYIFSPCPYYHQYESRQKKRVPVEKSKTKR